MRLTIMIGKDDEPYTNGDIVKGCVNLSLIRDSRLDHIDISLRGKACVRLKEQWSKTTHQRYVHGEHTFLKMSHPVECSDLRHIGTVRRPNAYETPFTFTIPNELLPYACCCGARKHGVTNERHYDLPPTFDGTRKGAKVLYAIKVRFRIRFADGMSKTIEQEKEVRILPSSAATRDNMGKPQILAEPETQSIQAAESNGSHGRLEAFTSDRANWQLDLKPESREIQVASVPINLRYRPFQTSHAPPTIREATFTFFGITTWRSVPDRTTSDVSIPQNCQRQAMAIRPEKIILQGLVWTTQTRKEPTSYHLTKASETMMTDSKPIRVQHIDSHFYTTTFNLPIRFRPSPTGLSIHELLPPTFSSCSISRAYNLRVKISFEARGSERGLWPCGRKIPGTLQRGFDRSSLAVEVPVTIRYGRQGTQATIESSSIDTLSGLTEIPWIDGMTDHTGREDPPVYTPTLR